jgi:hypothetical protein
MATVEFTDQDEFFVGTKPRVWNLSKVVADEVFIDYLLQSQGSNQARFLDRLEKNQRAARTQATILKALYVIMFAFLSVVPVQTFPIIIKYAENGTVASVAIFSAGGIVMGFYFVLLFVYLLVLGVINLSSLFTGDTFKWLETLPLSRQTRQKICLLAAFRSFDAPLVTLVIALPIIIGLLGGSVLLVIACAGASFLNMLLAFSLLVLIAEKFGRFTRANERTTGRANLARVMSMVAYMVVVFSIGIIVNLGIQNVSNIFTTLVLAGSNSSWFGFLSVIPYPFAPGYLVTAFVMDPASIPPTEWGLVIVGMVILVYVTWRVYSRAIWALRGVVSFGGPGAQSTATKGVEAVNLTKVFAYHTPVQAFRHKDLATASRDLQTMTFLIMPIILPFISLVPFLLATGGEGTETVADFLFTVWILLALLSILSASAILTGLLNLESTGASVLASLPIVPRDQAKAKLSIMLPLQITGFAVPIVLFVANPVFPQLALVIVASIPYVAFMLLATFLLKVRLFGRLRFKYAVEEVQMDHKTLKWGLIVFVDGVILIFVAIPAFLFLQGPIIIPFVAIILIIGVAGLCICIIFFNRMFPKSPARHV